MGGGWVSHLFQSVAGVGSGGGGRGRPPSDQTRAKLTTVTEALRANPKVTVQRLDGILSSIPKSENILMVQNEEGYNLLQKCVGINNVDLVRWILARNVDLNRGACSFPLHIACLKGYPDCVELLLKHGARVDVEARMCWPGPHNQNCEERGKHYVHDDMMADRSSDKLQSAICYAIDGDQVVVLEQLLARGGLDGCDGGAGDLRGGMGGGSWLVRWLGGVGGMGAMGGGKQRGHLLLHAACERGAYQCCKYLVAVRPDEINRCYDEYYPIHQAVLKPIRFLELLIEHGAETKVSTATQQMTVLHLVFLQGRKSAEDTLATCKLLLDHGLRDMINQADSLGNTPLHSLIVRYALEEARLGYDSDNPPWNKWDVMHLVRYLLQNGARPSINRAGNSALACVLRHVRDWEFRYELLNMLLQEGGNPNVVGRDGSVPLMVCLVPLINLHHDLLHLFTHTMKVCYLNCVRILLKHGANPNCTSRSNLTPLHVLMFAASETLGLARCRAPQQNMDFIHSLLVLLLQHGLDPNIRFSQRAPHILLAVINMVKAARVPADLNHVYSLTLTFLQYGANPDLELSTSQLACDSASLTMASSIYLRSAGAQPVLFHFVVTVSRRDDLLLSDSQTFLRIVWLYLMAMSHAAAQATLAALLRAQEAGVFPVRATALCALLREVYTRPPTLKQIARQAIYQSMDRRPGMAVNKLLPLPSVLREYLLNFEP
ncbi:ankyrin-1 [Nilaparvata lugens]|uniref:ankyrin-1 n=1 Tax=Nilaparvata lugens TaxID=108931 RepID=UPI00193D0379|nr:ankyrin-1 [Nilaparvata lugens]